MPTACLGQEISQGSTFSAKELEADSASGQKESFVQADGQSYHTALPKVSSAPNKGECRRESCTFSCLHSPSELPAPSGTAQPFTPRQAKCCRFVRA